MKKKHEVVQLSSNRKSSKEKGKPMCIERT